MPLSERRELAERPETEDTDDAVDTERSSWGTAFRASDGETQGSGEDARSGGGEGDVSMMADRGDVASCAGEAQMQGRRWCSEAKLGRSNEQSGYCIWRAMGGVVVAEGRC